MKELEPVDPRKAYSVNVSFMSSVSYATGLAKEGIVRDTSSCQLLAAPMNGGRGLEPPVCSHSR